MSGYTLTWVGDSVPRPWPADGAFLQPALSELDPLALSAWPIRIGHTTRTLDHFFKIDGDLAEKNAPRKLTVRNAPRWSRVGARMTGGELIIEGDVGDELGASMTGGLIRVTGSAGHRVAGPDFGTTRGANGGTIIVNGNVGDYAGLRMRRGLVFVGGSAGASPGFRMLAGSIVIAHGALDHPLLEARRGTVLSLEHSIDTIGLRGLHLLSDEKYPVESIAALRLLLSHLRSLGVAIDESVFNGTAELWSGDRFELGKGELWQWVSGS